MASRCTWSILSPFATRDLIVQAGAFGEHQFSRVEYGALCSDYPGDMKSYASPELQVETRATEMNSKHLQVHMPPATEITLRLSVSRFVNQPSTALPW